MALAIPQPQIIGGTTAVDLTVERRLQTVVAAFGTSGEVTRYSGSDRYATGARVARSAFDPESNQIGVLDGKATAFLVSGASATDASPRADPGPRPGIITRRIEGVDRQATAVAVANFAIETLGWDPTHINLARGDDFADATSAAPHAGQERAPLLFNESPDQLGTAAAAFLRPRQHHHEHRRPRGTRCGL